MVHAPFFPRRGDFDALDLIELAKWPNDLGAAVKRLKRLDAAAMIATSPADALSTRLTLGIFPASVAITAAPAVIVCEA